MVERHVQAAPYFEISERSAEVARIVRDDEVAGSIPAAPTKEKCGGRGIYLPAQELKHLARPTRENSKYYWHFSPIDLSPAANRRTQKAHQMASLCFDSAQHPESVEWVKYVVGVKGLEPSTSASQTRRASQLRHTPNMQ